MNSIYCFNEIYIVDVVPILLISETSYSDWFVFIIINSNNLNPNYPTHHINHCAEYYIVCKYRCGRIISYETVFHSRKLT